MKRNFCYTLLSLLFVTLLTTCDKDEESAIEIIQKNNDKEITVSLSIPHTINATRALSEEEEFAVESAEILAFDPQTDQFCFISFANTITEQGNTCRFNVTLIEGEYNLLFLTNSRKWIAESYPSGIPSGESKEDLQKTLAAHIIGKWDTDASSSNTNYHTIPMWGETNATVIVDENLSTNGISNIKMTRMLARVDVTLSPLAQTNFKLKTIRLYNYNTRGLLMPDTTDPDKWNTALSQATGASLPPDPAKANDPTPEANALLYDGMTTENIACLSEIYLFETIAGSKTNFLENTCLVVGGEYSEDGFVTSKTTYYRADFAATENNQTEYFPVKRNHRYIFTVGSIAGLGKETPEEAFRSYPINIDITVNAWDEHDMNDLETDGQYQLTVNQSAFDFYAEGRAQTLKVYTDYPHGWKVETATLPSWITVNPDNDNSGTSMPVSVSTDPIPSPLEEREASFWITTGSIRKEIKVRQTNVPELTLTVSSNQIVFRKSGSTAKSILVTAYPETSIVQFLESQTTNPISWVPGTGFPVTGIQLIGSYSFQPNENNSGSLASSLVTVLIEGSDGNVASQTITIYQLATDLLFRLEDKSDLYPATGGTATFRVFSDTDWYIASVEEASGQPQMVSSGWDNSVHDPEPDNGRIYSFSLTPNNTWDKRYATLKVGSSDEDFIGDIVNGKEIQIVQNYTTPFITLDGDRIDFGNAANATTQKVKVISNAEWTFTTDSNWNSVVSSPNSGSSGGSQGYTNSNTTDVSFTSVAYLAENGTPAAGTLSTKATFTTKNHAPASAPTPKTLTITRVVPAYFVTAGDGTITRAGQNVTSGFYTNAAWYASSNSIPGTTINTGTQNPSPWGLKQASVYIPANETWSKTTSAEKRKIIVNTYYGPNTSSMTIAGGAYNIYQPGYYISAHESSLTSNIAAAKSRSATVSLTGAYPTRNNSIRAWDTTNSKQLGNLANITGGESGKRTSTTVTIPVNDTWKDRDVQMQFYHPGTEKWTNTGAKIKQAGYYISAHESSLTSNIVGYNTTNATVSLTGAYPTRNNSVQAWDRTNDKQLGNFAHITGRESGKGTSTNVTIPTNDTWKERNIQMQFYHPGTDNWTFTGNQIKQSAGYVISNATRTMSSNTIADATFTVTLTGRWGTTINVRAAVGGTSAANRTAIGTPGTITAQTANNITTSKTSGTVKTGRNTSEERKVYIQYQHPANGWTDITSFTQPGVIILSTGFVVAEQSIAAMTWAEAAGLTTTGSSTNYNNKRYATLTSLSKSYSFYGSQNTGCNAYHEDNDGGKRWRIPSYVEMLEIRTKLGTLDSSHWTSYEHPSSSNDKNSTYAYYVSNSSSATPDGSNRIFKTTQLKSRCVRAK